MQRYEAAPLQPPQPLLLDFTFQSAIESLAVQGMPWLVPLSSDFTGTSATLLDIPI